MRVPDEFLRVLDDWRRHQPDIPSRSEAARRLVDIGLTASEAPKPGPSPREVEEQAEIDLRGGAGWIFHEGVAAGRVRGAADPPYTTPLARELWLKGYIKALKDPGYDVDDPV